MHAIEQLAEQAPSPPPPRATRMRTRSQASRGQSGKEGEDHPASSSVQAAAEGVSAEPQPPKAVDLRLAVNSWAARFRKVSPCAGGTLRVVHELPLPVSCHGGRIMFWALLMHRCTLLMLGYPAKILTLMASKPCVLPAKPWRLRILGVCLPSFSFLNHRSKRSHPLSSLPAVGYSLMQIAPCRQDCLLHLRCCFPTGAVEVLQCSLVGTELGMEDKAGALLQRLAKFAGEALPRGSGEAPPLLALVTKLHECLASTETFPVLLSTVQHPTSSHSSYSHHRHRSHHPNGHGSQGSGSGSSLSNGLVSQLDKFLWFAVSAVSLHLISAPISPLFRPRFASPSSCACAASLGIVPSATILLMLC